MNPEDPALREISPSQKDKHCMIPLARGAYCGPIPEDGLREAGTGWRLIGANFRLHQTKRVQEVAAQPNTTEPDT